MRKLIPLLLLAACTAKQEPKVEGTVTYTIAPDTVHIHDTVYLHDTIYTSRNYGSVETVNIGDE